MRHLLSALAIVALAASAHAARARPPLCEPGTFVVEEATSPLVPGGGAVPDRIVLASDGSLAIESGCPAAPAKQKAGRRGNAISAKWTAKSGACSGLSTASLKGSFDTGCGTLTGIFKSKGATRAFAAVRSAETLGAPALAPVPDASRHTTKTLGPRGGDVFARAADGTRFRLAVPPGALTGEVAITLTPVASLGGLPLDGGLLAAVDLGPAGLAFAVPATLYVMPAGGVPDGALAGFAWSGPANAFAVSPSRSDSAGRWLALVVEHFSGYGIGIPGPSQLDALVGSLLALAASAAEVAGVLTACLADTNAPCTEPDIESVLVEWYDTIVAPRLAAAGGAPVVEVITAHEALRSWSAAVFYATDFFDVLPASVGARRSQGLAQDFANLKNAFDRYTMPTCNGAVSDWKDWLRVPEELKVRAATLHEADPDFLLAFALGPDAYCARFLIADLSFPPDVAPDTTELPLSFATYLVVFAQPLEPIAGRVALSYSEGASGPAEVVTSADGTLDEPILVQRTPGSPLFVTVDLFGVELELDRPDALSDSGVVHAGALAFEENLSPLASPILAPDATSEHCVTTALPAAENQTVQLALEGPGTLSADHATLEFDPVAGMLRACVDYTTPDGPVAKGETAELRATLLLAGQSYEDALTLHPRWVEIGLEADVGAGLENATNQILWIPDTGPFAIAATVMGPGETVDDPAGPVAGANLDAQGQAALLSPGGSGGTPTLPLTTSAAGKAGFALTADAAETTHAVELRHDPQGSSLPAGVVLKRIPPVMALSLPGTVIPGTPAAFEVAVTEGNEPAPGYHVELAVTGGNVGADSGTTNLDGKFQTSATLDPGQTLLTITATLRAEPDGEALDVKTAEATGGAAGSVVFVSRQGYLLVRCGAASQNGEPFTELDLFSPDPENWTLSGPPCSASFAGASGSASASGLLEVATGSGGSLERVYADLEGEAQEATSDGANAYGTGSVLFGVIFEVVGEPVPYQFDATASADGAEIAVASAFVGLGAMHGNAWDLGCADDHNFAGAHGCEGSAGLPIQSGVLPPGRYLLYAYANSDVSNAFLSGSASTHTVVELTLGAAAP